MKEQITINTLEFAQKSHEIRGTIAPRDLGRMHDILFSDDGELFYQLHGGKNSRGQLEIRLELEGELSLICQRCMGPFKHVVDTTASFVIVPDEASLPDPEDELDDADYLVAEQRFDVGALIEDEIILGLPMAPLHEAAECGLKTAAAGEKKESPFKVLQGLKLGKS